VLPLATSIALTIADDMIALALPGVPPQLACSLGDGHCMLAAGRTLAKLGQTHKAVEELEAALALEVADLNAHNEKLDAQDMIAKLRASGVMHQFLPCLPASPLAPGLPGKGEDQAS
jgi:hypothetical protein